MRGSLKTLVCAVITGWCTSAFAASALLELTVDGEARSGRVVAKDNETCWLMGRDGRVHEIDLDAVSSYRKLSPQFRRFDTVEMRNELKREFGASYEVSSTQHYLVCAAPGKGRAYADLFEQVYRNFQRYFSTRGFRIPEPEFPLVAIVFPEREGFVKYCRDDDVSPAPGLMGYYLRSSNRVALYNPGGDESQLRDTIIHEATHQVAFNTGLHGRVGETPKWIVEGLATVFEAPGVRDGSHKSATQTRLNRDRYVWFGDFSKSRRPDKSLAEFLAGDELFQRATLDAYSQAWALSFFLIETRPSDYARYLRTVADRDPMQPYPAEERLADFRSAFGADLEWLDTEFLRFFEKLNQRDSG
jgi:hypothetical protein